MALAGQVSAQSAPVDSTQGSPEQRRGAPLTILDVPFISQSEALCGGAAAAMVLRYWGERGLTAESFSHLVDRSAAGIRTDALVNELPDQIPNSFVVAASGLAGMDRFHFDLKGQRALGRRYAETLLVLPH